jgi:hypothetical protein
MEHEGGLPDPRGARQHDDRPRDQTATEDAVEARHPGPEPRLVFRGVERNRPDDIPSRPGHGTGGLIDRSPRGTPGASTRPLGQALSARRADERDPILGHAVERTVGL